MQQSLRERLEALRAIQSYVESRWDKPGENQPEGAPSGKPSEAGAATAGGTTAVNPVDISEVLDGDDEETPLGACFHRLVRYPLSTRYGRHRLGELLRINQESVGLMAQPRQEALDFREAVFLDTETTGLAGGVGTYAFLVGVGHFQDDAFILHQFFLRDYPEEPALLWALNQIISKFRYLVTYCGRGFDWPLLETRFIFNRMRPGMPEPVHVDLVHPARRLWKERWGSCRLANLEDKILGAGRDDDVPGALIPGLYFDYLRSKDARPLSGVLTHNERDIVALVALATALGRRYEDPATNSECPYELRGLGRQYESLGRWEKAVECYEASFMAAPAVAPAREALFRKACLLKKLQRFDEAAVDFHHLVGEQAASARMLDTYVVDSAVELAKYYEHKTKDPMRALEITQRAIELVMQQRRYSQTGRVQMMEALRHRQERLNRKATKAT